MSLTDVAPPATAAAGPIQRMREATRAAHDRLEAALDLLAEPLERGRFQRLLERFWGFHAVFEPALARALEDEPFLAPRRKLPLLEADLRGLGCADDHIRRLPRCLEAVRLAPLPGRPATALGALYVLEGSTLGGQVISRALAGADWLPAGGLRYLNPYGPATGARWREFREYAASFSGPAAEAEMTAAAEATFERLLQWLT